MMRNEPAQLDSDCSRDQGGIVVGIAEVRAIAMGLPQVVEGGPVSAARRIAAFKVAGKRFSRHRNGFGSSCRFVRGSADQVKALIEASWRYSASGRKSTRQEARHRRETASDTRESCRPHLPIKTNKLSDFTESWCYGKRKRGGLG